MEAGRGPGTKTALESCLTLSAGLGADLQHPSIHMSIGHWVCVVPTSTRNCGWNEAAL